MRKQKTRDNGITLIALVISIIVMLILAGVNLNATIGENGIITRAQEAKIAQEDAVWYENAEMVLTDAYASIDKIDDMRGWLINKFENFSDGEPVYVTEYMDGYLIVSGKRMITVDGNMQISSSRQLAYMISSDEDWYFLPNGTGTCKLTAYKLDLAGTISIPSAVIDKETENVYMVTELADDIFNYATRINKVDFSNAQNLEKIGARVFSNCINLNIKLPDDLPNSVNSIGDNAFLGCPNQVELPDSENLICIGSQAFWGCNNLGNNNVNKADIISWLENSNIEIIDDKAFYMCTSLKEVEFDNNINLSKIPSGCFYRCFNLQKINLPISVTEISDTAFCQDNLLTKIDIPPKLKSIGSNAFSGPKLENITLPQTLTSIGGAAFSSARFKNLVIPDSVTTIGDSAFKNCSAFRYNILLPPQCVIAENAFDNCPAIVSK